MLHRKASLERFGSSGQVRPGLSWSSDIAKLVQVCRPLSGRLRSSTLKSIVIFEVSEGEASRIPPAFLPKARFSGLPPAILRKIRTGSGELPAEARRCCQRGHFALLVRKSGRAGYRPQARVASGTAAAMGVELALRLARAFGV